MEITKNRKLIMIAPLLVVIAIIFGNSYALIRSFALSNSVSTIFLGAVSTIFTIFTLVISGIYLLSEFSKTSSKYFKFFLYLYIFAEFSNVMNVVVATTAQVTSIPATFWLDVVLGIFIFVSLNILYFKKDLGKNVSLTFSYLILIANLMNFVVMLQVAATNEAVKLSLYSRGAAFVCLSIVLIIMETLKYYDKSQRNTK